MLRIVWIVWNILKIVPVGDRMVLTVVRFVTTRHNVQG